MRLMPLAAAIWRSRCRVGDDVETLTSNDTRRAVIERSIAQAMQHLRRRRVNKKRPDGDAIGLFLFAPRCCRNRMVAATRERTLSCAADCEYVLLLSALKYSTPRNLFI